MRLAAAMLLGLATGCLGPEYPDVWDPDGDGFGEDTDCVPDDPAIHPQADEDCADGVDNNCDGLLDGEDSGCIDADGDGYTQLIDCDDTDASTYPGAEEICDGQDNDCDGALPVDETDLDGDGYVGCEECDDDDPSLNLDDADGDGLHTCEGDCDDADTTVLDVCLVSIPAGAFTMGSSADEVGHYPHEVQNEVTLTRGFHIGVTEVTQAQFERTMGWDPTDCAYGCGTGHPVQAVSWLDAVALANEVSMAAGLQACYALSDVVCEDGTSVGADVLDCMNGNQGGIAVAGVALDGVATPYECEGYRLPTEAEWEYAARSAGTVTESFPNGGDLLEGDEDDCDGDLTLDDGSYLDDIGWYCGNSGDLSHPVAELAANGYGLYDVSGNVWEWCHDWWGDYSGGTDPWGSVTGLYRVCRGGSASAIPESLRVARRDGGEPGFRHGVVGVRLARTAP